MPAITPEKASIRKLLRTRSADQLRSVCGTLRKISGALFARRPISVAMSANVTLRTIGWGRSLPAGGAGRHPDAVGRAAGRRIRLVRPVRLAWDRFGSRPAAVDGKRSAHARQVRSS